MRIPLNSNITTGAVTVGGDAWTAPVLIYGESLTLAFTTTKSVNGVEVDAPLTIVSTQVAPGAEDARPTGGTWRLQIGTGSSTLANTTAELQFNADAAALRVAINALTAVTGTYGAAAVQYRDGSFWIVFADAGAETPVPMQVRENELMPVTLYELNAWTFNDRIVHELRLKQAPLAFVDTAARVLPPAPEVVGSVDGSVSLDGSSKKPEEQLLKLDPEWRGQFTLKTEAGAETQTLSHDDDETAIQPALEAILGAGNVEVTLATDFTYKIAFIGELIGIDWPLLTATPKNEAQGPLTATLILKGYPLLRALRAAPAVTMPIEVRVEVQVTEDTREEIVLLRDAITVRRPVTWQGLATEPNIDWLVPPSRINRVPFNRSQVITGHQFNRMVFGDGAETVVPFPHGLNSDALGLQVRENVDGGALLIAGTDYSVVFDSANLLTLTALTGPPATDAWAITVISSETVSAFADGLTLEIGQVNGLEDRLTAAEEALATLQTQAATQPLGLPSTTTAAGTITIEMPEWAEVLPTIEPATGAVDLQALPFPGGLLPAMHKAAAISVTTVLPAVSAGAGNVYQNNIDPPAAIVVPGGLGMRSSTLAPGEYAASDGRRWYPMSRMAGTTSYFARDFERLLFSFEVTAGMLRLGHTLSVEWLLALQMLQFTARAQYEVITEWSAITADTTPTTDGPDETPDTADDEAPAPNLAAITPTGLLSRQVIVMDRNKLTAPFGIEVVRKANGDMAANQIFNGFSTGAISVPDSAVFGVRGWLKNFDTVNNVSNARGTIYYQLSAGLVRFL
jgi:hypothetical protein